MKKNNLILSKTLVIISVLTVTISLSIFPLFNWGVPLKKNIAIIIITLIVNKEPITSSFYKQLMTSDSIVSLYTFGTLLIFNLTYLIPLIFIKKPFSRSVFAIHMLLITLVLILFVLVLFNYFNIRNFQTIPFKDLWTIPWAGIGLSLLTIFWYGLKNLWVNPPQLSKKTNDYSKSKKEEIKSDDLPSYEDLQLQLKMLKKQLKEVRNFQTIPFKDLWTIPWAGIGLSLLTIFWYGLKNLWVNPPQLSKKTNDYSKSKKEEIKSDDLPSYEDLQLQLKMLKKQLKEVRNIKTKK